MKLLTTFCAAIAAIQFFSVSANADEAAAKPEPSIKLGTPFTDNAILQRGMKVPVWGWSKPGTKITVEFAGQKKSTTAALSTRERCACGTSRRRHTFGRCLRSNRRRSR